MSLNVEILETSFDLVKLKSDQVATSFYSYLFADYPEVKPLFANSDMTEQRKKLVNSLVVIVDVLRNPEELSHTLRGLGTRHIKYGVTPEHYPMVGNSLLKAFESNLGSSWTPEVKQSWVDAYDAIADLMLDGAKVENV
jgi:hemoglobin-like flavoprotein